MIDRLNQLYNQVNDTKIGFYLKCDPTYINNSQHLNKTLVGAHFLMTSNIDDGSINVHVVNSLEFGAAGMAYMPYNACIVDRQTYVQNSPTLAHEVGHILGLVHTHLYAAINNRCYTESVNRTRTWPAFNLCIGNRLRSRRVCESTGDALSDTQADPNLLNNMGCNYNLGGNDPWGDSYDNPPNGPQERPNTANIMSYANDNCQSQFTRQQIAVMLHALHKLKPFNKEGWRNPLSTFDDFEPDNEAITADNITLNQVQERNFHQQYNRSGGNISTTQCDVDWARFVPTCSGSFSVQTSAISGRTNANTRLTLFDANLNQLAQNDDISTSNLFSSVTFNFVAGQTYFIRVENMSINVTGYYNLSIGPQFNITGNDAFCNSGVYSVNNLPAGATVTWNATPTGIVQFSCNPCSTVTAQRMNDGVVTITATINSNCFATPPVITKQITVGSTYIQATVNGPDNAIANAGYYFSLSTNPWNAVISNINWRVPAGWTISSGQGTRGNVTIWTGTQTGDVEVDFDDACGITRSVFKNVVIGDGGDIQPLRNGGEVSVYPNPASDVITVSLSGYAKLNTNFVKQIKITNKMGLTVLDLKYNDRLKSKQVNISNLKPDVYTVQVYDNKTWHSIKFMKQ